MGRKASKSRKQPGLEEPLHSREIVWIGSSKDDISAMPKEVKGSFGFRLRQIQEGKPTADTKALTQFGAGVLELRESFDTNAYRCVIAVRLKSAVYALAAFKKKSKSGIGLSKADIKTIETRLKRAIELDKEANCEKD